MRLPVLNADSPLSWKESHRHDLEEIFGPVSSLGYRYAYENRRRHTLNFIRDAVPPSGEILDIAGAQGNFSIALAELGYQVTWNDLREELADYIRLKADDSALKRIHFAPGNAFELGYKERFDCVLITEIIEHVAHPDEFLRSAANMVRPGGHIVMSTPNGAYFGNKLPRFSACQDPSIYEHLQFKPNSDGHIFLLWPDEVRRMGEAAGLVCRKHKLFTTPLTNGFLKTRFLLSLLPKSCIFLLERATILLPAWINTRLMLSSATLFQKAS